MEIWDDYTDTFEDNYSASLKDDGKNCQTSHNLGFILGFNKTSYVTIGKSLNLSGSSFFVCKCVNVYLLGFFQLLYSGSLNYH